MDIRILNNNRNKIINTHFSDHNNDSKSVFLLNIKFNMKQLKFIFPILISIFLFSSCSVYENIYFSENGNVKYEMTIDASEMLKSMPSANDNYSDKLPSDSVIHLASVMGDSLNIATNDTLRQAIKDIEPLYLTYKTNPSDKTLKVSMYGDFANIEALNKALTSMCILNEQLNNGQQADIPKESFPLAKLYARSSLYWDGTNMKRTVAEEINNGLENEDDPNGEDKNTDPFSSQSQAALLSKMFMNGRIIVKYHLPKKTSNISNPNATISQDGKTVVVEYPGSVLSSSMEDIAIEINTK